MSIADRLLESNHWGKKVGTLIFIGLIITVIVLVNIDTDVMIDGHSYGIYHNPHEWSDTSMLHSPNCECRNK